MEILEYLAKNIYNVLNVPAVLEKIDKLEEIRLRGNKNIVLKFNNEEVIVSYKVTIKDLLETLEKVTENSVYTYEKQISQGFITLAGGHRVGVVGNAVNEDDKITNISYVSGMNFRIAREIKGCGNFIIKRLYENGNFQNTLIVGSPGSGKTTLLRDLIRQVSNGNQYNKGLNVGVVDERNELAAMYKGSEQTDLGLRTDVIANIPKKLGIKILIRSMAPEVIAVDEIGGIEDSKMIYYAMCSGTKALLTAHGNSLNDIKINPELQELMKYYVIEKIIILDSHEKEKIKGVYFLDKEKRGYRRECI